MKLVLLLSLFTSTAASSIFDSDDRVDTRFTNAKTQEIGRSVPALIQKHRIKQISDKYFSLTSEVGLSTEMNMCSDEQFSSERVIANCSASLIAPQLVLTAAHCLDSKDYQCESYSVVFDYQKSEDDTYLLEKNQIYQCKKLRYFNFDTISFGVDLAVIELDRPVVGRNPVKLKNKIELNEELFMIGYPLGISQKVSDQGRVLSIDKARSSFKTDLDSFSVNSGSPIFNDEFEQVGVLVRGTGLNLKQYNGESCYRWHLAKSSEEFSEGNSLATLPSYLLDDK